MAARKSVTVY